MKLIKGLLISLLLLTIIITIVSGTHEETSGFAPVITGKKDSITVSCDYSEKDLLEGLTAYDIEDGYITDSILAGKITPFIKRGVSEINYYVYDSDGLCGTYKRELVFSDYNSPKVLISQPLVFYPNDASESVLMNCIYGEDCLDGDVKHIKVNSSDIDYAKAGDYTFSISLINSFGDTATYNLPVHIVKNTIGGVNIRLNDNLIYIKTGTEFDPSDYVKEVEQTQIEEPLPQKDWGMDIQSNVDTSKTGVYEVRYMIKKEQDVVYGDISGMNWLTVIVED